MNKFWTLWTTKFWFNITHLQNCGIPWSANTIYEKKTNIPCSHKLDNSDWMKGDSLLTARSFRFFNGLMVSLSELFMQHANVNLEDSPPFLFKQYIFWRTSSLLNKCLKFSVWLVFSQNLHLPLIHKMNNKGEKKRHLLYVLLCSLGRLEDLKFFLWPHTWESTRKVIL